MWIVTDGNVVEPIRPDSCLREAPRRRERREPGDMFNAVEALLLGGGDEFAVNNEGCRGVAVKGVEAEDRRHSRMVVTAVLRLDETRPRSYLPLRLHQAFELGSFVRPVPQKLSRRTHSWVRLNEEQVRASPAT
jgi:hypothetical protein